jgi:putative transposase
MLKNHFHFLVRIKKESEVSELMKLKQSKQNQPLFLSQQFSNCFNAYNESINKMYNRTGSLFEERFERKLIENRNYLKTLIHYIHQNPQHHEFVTDFRQWNHSSYNSHLSENQTKLLRENVRALFCSISQFQSAHN